MLLFSAPFSVFMFSLCLMHAGVACMLTLHFKQAMAKQTGSHYKDVFLPGLRCFHGLCLMYAAPIHVM
jgi:hypothetical protein